MPYTFHGGSNGFPIKDLPRTECQAQAESIFSQPLQDFQLHRSHDVHKKVPAVCIPLQMKRGFFILQGGKARIDFFQIRFLFRNYAVAQNGFQNRIGKTGAFPKNHSGRGMGESRNGGNIPGMHFRAGGEAASAVQADLIYLLPDGKHLRVSGRLRNLLAGMERAAG